MSANVISRFPAYEKKEWKIYKESQKLFWAADIIEIGDVASDFTSATNEHRKFFRDCLISAAIDCVRFRSISVVLMKDFKDLEAIYCFGYQMMVDKNHHAFYARILHDTVQEVQRRLLFNKVEQFPSTRAKTTWSTLFSTPAWRIIGYACTKGIFGATMRVAALWYKMNMTSGHKCFSVVTDLISKELKLQFQFAFHMYTITMQKPGHRAIRSVVNKAIEIEQKFCVESKFCAVTSIKLSDMMSFIKYCGDSVYDVLQMEEPDALPPVLRWAESAVVSKREIQDPVE